MRFGRSDQPHTSDGGRPNDPANHYGIDPDQVVAPDVHHIPGLKWVHLPVRPAWLGVIFLGGTLGTALRAGLGTMFPADAGAWPWATWWVNLSGAMLLGMLLEALAETGPDEGWRLGVRLGVGTGVLGGFTTYSAFAVETLQLAQEGAWPVAMGYALGSVVVGVLAAGVGVWAVRRTILPHRRSRGVPR